MQLQKEKQKKPISARDKEKINVIINCACEYFSIDKSNITMPGKLYTNIRRLCFFIISKNTELSHGQIAEMFNKDRSQATRGLDIIDAHKNIYTPTLHQLKDIIKMCNNFENKQFEWDIQF